MSAAPVKGPRILLLDIETAPILAFVWSIWEQNVGLNQIKQDWHLMSWAAKWLDSHKVMYEDQRSAKDITNDKRLLQGIWKLLDEADIIITQNGKAFDQKKLYARFIKHGMKPPSSFQHIDTKIMAKRHFAFTSNKLEYMAEYLGAEVKKLKEREFDGFTLWRECMLGNLKAWREMERYNKADVLALEGVYRKLQPWDSSLNFETYYPQQHGMICACGSTEFKQDGYDYQAAGKYKRYRCKKCWSRKRLRVNEHSIEKRKSMSGKVR